MTEHQKSSHQHVHEEGRVAAAPDVWFAATWPFIRGQLPEPPARVVELGCGQAGGHVPALVRAGYDATGVDPQAPDGPAYRQETFESYLPDGPVDAVIASLSLHHTDDLGVVLQHVSDILRPDGCLVVVEWISEAFDEATARWCFRHRLRTSAEGNGWLAELHDDWAASGLPWTSFFKDQLEHHGLHPAAAIRRELDARFVTIHESSGPYYFRDLLDADELAEQAAIDAGEIRAGCLRYAGKRARN